MQRKVLYFNNFTISQCYHTQVGVKSTTPEVPLTSSLCRPRRKLCRKLSFERRRWGVAAAASAAAAGDSGCVLLQCQVINYKASHWKRSHRRSQHQNVATAIGEVSATFWLLKIVKFMHLIIWFVSCRWCNLFAPLLDIKAARQSTLLKVYALPWPLPFGWHSEALCQKVI